MLAHTVNLAFEARFKSKKPITLHMRLHQLLIKDYAFCFSLV